jgi:hypothetical protein
MAKTLDEMILENPKAVFIVDNDCWWMYASEESYGSGDTYIACDGTHGDWLASGYGSGCAYGGDILQALARIVGVKVESV